MRASSALVKILGVCLILTALSSFVSSPVVADSPSFDCRLAKLPDETAICSSAELSEMDNLHAAGFIYLRAQLGLAKARAVARPMLSKRRACLSDINCILQSQIEAIKTYQNLGAPITLPSWLESRDASVVGSPALANSQTFDCRLAKAPDEIAICASVELSEMDRLIARGDKFALSKDDNMAYRISEYYSLNRANCLSDEICILQNQVTALKQYQETGARLVVPNWVKVKLDAYFNSNTSQEKDEANTERWKCLHAAAENLVSTTSESAESLLPAVLNRCSEQTTVFEQKFVADMNRVAHIMGLPGVQGIEKIVEDGRAGINPEILAIIVEARARQNSVDSPKARDAAKTEATSYGTGFLVSREGDIVSNAHVVENCRGISVRQDARESSARIVGTDTRNDIVLLRVDALASSPATIRPGRNAKAGDYVAVFGYPLPGALSESGNIVQGNITALAGLGDDVRVYQISAPIQPGNSGGPLLDKNGNIAGIVNAKLDELIWAKETGSLPQNVNFAIKSSVLTDFLDAHSVAYVLGESDRELDLTAIGERATRFTFQIVCER